MLTFLLTDIFFYLIIIFLIMYVVYVRKTPDILANWSYVFRNKTGIQTLEMMASVVSYSNPQHFDADNAAIEKNWLDGNAAIGMFWASQFNKLNSENTSIHMALSLDGGITPASSIWFKGFTVARYVVESEAVAAMRKRWNACSACIIEICTPRTYILNGINVQGNPNIERNVSYAEIWKDGYYKTYEPKLNVVIFDESELQISKNIADICRILHTHNKSGLFLGHLVDPSNPHPARARNNATLEAAFDASGFGLVKYFDCSSFVEEYGFRILENGSQDIHHLPWECLESLAKSFEFAVETLIDKGN